MQNGNFRIKVAATRQLQADSKREALAKNIWIDDKDLLQVQYRETEAIRHALVNNALPIVFTSVHGVKAYRKLEKAANQAFPIRNAFVISGKTREQAMKAGFEILGAAPDAQGLAPVIAQATCRRLLHLTANLRRDELYTALQQLGIELTALEVYEKTLAPATFEKFDALLVFSPSQVDAFLQKNHLPANCPVFCIGKTTAVRVGEIPHQQTIIADHPSESGVLRKLYAHFNC